MNIFTPNKIVSQELAMAQDLRYLAFRYNNSPRVGLDVCEDNRNPMNRVIMTLDGLRTMNKDRMLEVRDVTSVVV